MNPTLLFTMTLHNTCGSAWQEQLGTNLHVFVCVCVDVLFMCIININISMMSQKKKILSSTDISKAKNSSQIAAYIDTC